MKKVFNFFMSLILLSSCNDGDLIKNAPENPCVDVKTVVVRDGKVVENVTRVIGDDDATAYSFSSEENLTQFRAKLEVLTHDERLQLAREMGVITMHDVAFTADEELELIGEEAVSESQFAQLYASFVDKYKGKLIVNYVDSTDISLYVPDSDNVDTYIANAKGQYVVAGRVRTLNVNMVLSEPDIQMSLAYLKFSEGSSQLSTLNSYVFSPKKHKKVYFNIGIKYGVVRVKMNAKKKMWYGWKNDPHRTYIFEPHLTNISYKQPISPRYDFKRKNGIEYDLGVATGNVSGDMYTWTDMTCELDANGNIIRENLNGYNVVKCLPIKSKTVRVNLSKY